ncbi:MAG: type I glyceraldehyde-3-phosphate dehydrogenase [Furfurilactobacillus sp.]|jgi:glyceraldehyde 3-phosphate dehydrogenase|uniref:Glyceraldehyde-3-phosphate dehydrogenase n=1 Tax=Furfurilactobacillus milii TaxID=2888272 RepID=A0ABT6DC86_9LACO|nr:MULTISPECIES: type I glyceraldehyde-3-phosphate dehydrogenase [Furfurilactobacillus]QLE65682.1 NAD-dependent glyceraldehyde-3-phosphate dehydrogenase [Furfurilactobacillus rossiae]MCF6161838.1 type I glyceraldehyde-3-phosphate dehydrogenase [Furfurilactobacillus milii]MCF6164218.1 type I glyceraldehyde-3-phosphate dehydrogenase [Furfurilactobacillus milii]MCF6420039.1 type I glyceraldehyde-3-phosphate dehydrogenase [Furfurilactobacillus milii]MCH4012209.1 type I glyceraldehyde-3-phosphate d
MANIGINGFGRIGRDSFRRMLALNDPDLNVVAINDLTSPAMLAYLLKYDSTFGIFDADVSSTDDSLVVNGKKIRVYAERNAAQIPWVANDGVDIVLECTGFYTSKEKSQAHLDAGAKKVVISAPAGPIKTLVEGVNDDLIAHDDQIVSVGSCTTNALAPMAYFLNKEFGLEVGTITAIHAFTSSQNLLDGPKGKNFRPNRTASSNTIPHSTGAASAIGLVIPELEGHLNGHAQRVAVIDGSICELVSILDKKVTADEVNAAIKPYTENNPAFGWNEDEIVSSDIIGDTHGAVFDPTQTEVTQNGDFQVVKTHTWFDNEFGFVCNMIRILKKEAVA